MTTIHTVRSEIDALRIEARGLVDTAGTGDATATTRFEAIRSASASSKRLNGASPWWTS